MTQVTAIVVGWKGDAWLPDCVATLERAYSGPLRLILVDNFANRGLAGLDLTGLDHRVLRTPYPMGFAEANNFALVKEAISADIVLFLNQDTRSEAGWIDACVSCFDAEPTLAVLSPELRTFDQTRLDEGFEECVRGSKPERPWYPVPRVTGAAMLVRREALLRTGPFDPIYGSYYEDYDLCARMRRAGFQVGVCPEARVFHYGGSSTEDPAARRRRLRWTVRNRVILRARESKNGRAASLSRSFLLSLPRRLARGAVRTGSSQPPAVTLGAYRDVVRLLPRLASVRRDDKAWRRYLGRVGWNSLDTSAPSDACASVPADARCLFFLSTGRTATTTMTHLMALSGDVDAHHEPPPKRGDPIRSAPYHGAHDTDRLGRIFRSHRGDLISRAHAAGKVYVETNGLKFYAQVIRELLPQARFVFLHRHPGPFVVSGLRRGWYGGHPADFARLVPGEDDPWAPAWTEMDPFSKICWLWAATNRYFADFADAAADSCVTVAFADLIRPESRAYGQLFALVGLGPPSEVAVGDVLGVRHNRQPPDDTPAFPDWSRDRLDRLAEIAGPTMSRLGYSLVPDERCV